MSQQNEIFDYFPTRSSVVTVSHNAKSTIKSNDPALSQSIKLNKNGTTPNKRSISPSSSFQVDDTRTPSKRTRSERKSAQVSTISIEKSKGKKTSKINFGNKSDINSIEIFNLLSKKKEEISTTNDNSEKISKEIKKGRLLDSEQIRQKLKSCKNISQLKQNLSTINGCAEKLKQFKEIKVHLSPVKPSFSKSPQKFRTPEKISVSGLSAIPSPLKAYKSPVKFNIKTQESVASTLPKLLCNRRLFADDPTENASDSVKTTPAYQRFDHLTKLKNSTDDSSLLLPLKYRELVKLFDRMDFLVDRSQKRHERCTLDKLIKSIETTTHRKFDLNVLKKILSVGQPGQWFKLSYEVVDGSNKLVIECNDKRRDMFDSITLHSLRVTEYNDHLLNLTKLKHVEFLAKMNLKISENERIFRWHPMFKLEDVPDIDINDNVLPKNTKPASQSANRTNSILNYFPKRSEINTETKASVQNDNANAEPIKTVQKGVLKGVSLDLLNKIRAKEAATKKRLMVQNPEVTLEITFLQNIPEVIRIIHSIFMESNTIQTIHYATLCEKLCDSFHSSFSINQADVHINYLLNSDMAKDWITMIETNQQKYIKINREYPLKNLFLLINNRITKLKNT